MNKVKFNLIIKITFFEKTIDFCHKMVYTSKCAQIERA